jgi:cellulose synthase/poly-beta-1,6-N-acetylglucosamine synthase-like glycosyltransferase
MTRPHLSSQARHSEKNGMRNVLSPREEELSNSCGLPASVLLTEPLSEELSPYDADESTKQPEALKEKTAHAQSRQDWQNIAEELGLVYYPALPLPEDRTAIPLPGPKAIREARSALIRPDAMKPPLLVLAPDTRQIGSLKALFQHQPHLRDQFAIASDKIIRAYLMALSAPALSRLSIERLLHRQPHLSAQKVITSAQILALFICVCLLVTGFVLNPVLTFFSVSLAAATLFGAIVTLRCLAVAYEDPKPLSKPLQELWQSEDFPVYSVLVPLYREADVVKDLVAALSALVYPAERLDIKLLVEEHDEPTRQALAALDCDERFEIIVVPKGKPQTKPRALSYAMALIRGDYVVVYDAEDRPDPDQLLKALEAFHKGPEHLACVQARLATYNGQESFFAAQFTAEYAGLFDVMLPVLARFRMPVPLGGTSNHFRRKALFHVGGWDPYNVTEDADLGMRLARKGWITGMIHSTTLEEAPTTAKVWYHQRTRWFKGWVQTWLVHMRHPLALLRDLGLRDFLAFQMLMIGMIVSACIHPFCVIISLGVIVQGFIQPELIMQAPSMEKAIFLLHGFVFLAGYAGSLALAWTGLTRRRQFSLRKSLIGMPLYWFWLSLAAWGALFDLIRRPHFWAKTPHGLSRQKAMSEV